MRRWFFELTEFKAEPGFEFRFAVLHKGFHYDHHCKVMAAQPNQKLAFKKGDIYHTYSSYARGIDLMNTTYNFLDLTAKGRNENPNRLQDWVRYHDQYKGSPPCCCNC